MRNLGFDGEPSAEVLERLNDNSDRTGLLVNTTELKKYLRVRCREEKLSLYRIAKAIGASQPQVSNALNKDMAISLERLERILWIVDGGTEKWNEYRSANDL